MKRPLIGLAISAACFVLSIGLCGISNTQRSFNLVGIGLLLFAASVVGIIISVIWLVVALVRGR